MEGCLLDNDNYFIEDEVYSYEYQEALDGVSDYQFRFISPDNDPYYISRDEFAIYYMNENLEKIPLYINSGSEFYRNEYLLGTKNPAINYINNAYILTIYWNKTSDIFIDYDTHLLITYKIIKGRPISPFSISSIDSYGHDEYSNLIEIPFAKYDMLNQKWIIEGEFIEEYPIEKILLSKEFTGGSTTIEGPLYEEGSINLGIIELDSVYVNKSENEYFEKLEEDQYSWEIDGNGDLHIVYHSYQSGDILKVTYYSYVPIALTHPANRINNSIEYIRIFSAENLSLYKEFTPDEYNISANGYLLYLLDLYNSILKNQNFTIYDRFEIKYRAPLVQKIDLSNNVLLLLQDPSRNYVPIDIIPIDNLGFFEYENKFDINGLSLPIGGRRVVNLRLAYLPEQIFDKSKNPKLSIGIISIGT
jgi:hypothetical protein